MDFTAIFWFIWAFCVIISSITVTKKGVIHAMCIMALLGTVENIRNGFIWEAGVFGLVFLVTFLRLFMHDNVWVRYPTNFFRYAVNRFMFLFEKRRLKKIESEMKLLLIAGIARDPMFASIAISDIAESIGYQLSFDEVFLMIDQKDPEKSAEEVISLMDDRMREAYIAGRMKIE